MGSARQPPSDAATAGVIVRPPLLYLGCLLLGLALDRVLPLPLTLPEAALIRWTAGGGLIVVGLAILAAGIRNFARAASPRRCPPTSRSACWSRHPRLEPQSDLRRHVSPLCRPRPGGA